MPKNEFSRFISPLLSVYAAKIAFSLLPFRLASRSQLPSKHNPALLTVFWLGSRRGRRGWSTRHLARTHQTLVPDMFSRCPGECPTITINAFNLAINSLSFFLPSFTLPTLPFLVLIASLIKFLDRPREFHGAIDPSDGFCGVRSTAAAREMVSHVLRHSMTFAVAAM